jgi:hypothetical protein
VSPVPPFATETGVDNAYDNVVALVVTDNPVPADGVMNAGSADAPPLTIICPAVPADVADTAAVPSPNRTPCAVNVIAPVPPLDTTTGTVNPIEPVEVIVLGDNVIPVPLVNEVTVPPVAGD